MMKMNRLLSLALALILSVSLIAPAAAADTAAAIQLTKTSGTVTVSKSNGKSVSMRTGMRLYNGYNVTTAPESYAWISLDSTKLVKLDESSSVEVRKNGSKLEVNVKYGSVSFNVSQKLNNNESLNVSSSTMTVGIRGTCGWVEVTDQWITEACLLEGASQCVVADPVTSQLKSAQLSGGDTARCVVYSQEKPGDKCDILMERQTTEGIPGFVLTDLVQDVGLCDKILDDSGLDVLADLAQAAGGDSTGRTPDGKSATPEVLGEAEQRLKQEEKEQAGKLEEIREKLTQQENNISQNNVWAQPSPAQPSSQPSRPGWPDWPDSANNPDTPSTCTVTFNANGGLFPSENATAAGSSSYSAVTGKDGCLAESSMPIPFRDGYRFDGWYTEADGGEPIDPYQVFTADTTLYAHWTAAAYGVTITFDPAGGTWEDGTTGAKILTADANGKVSAPDRPAPPDLPGVDSIAFGGWYMGQDTYVDINTQVFTQDTTLRAKWVATVTSTHSTNPII